MDGKIFHKAPQRLPLPLQLQLHAGGGIFHRAIKSMLLHIAVEEGPEAHPLHDAANMYQRMAQAQARSSRFGKRRIHRRFDFPGASRSFLADRERGADIDSHIIT